MGNVLLKLVDQSGPVTLAAGKRIVDVVDGPSGNVLGTIEWKEFGKCYAFYAQGDSFNADELTWIAAVLNDMKMEKTT